MQASISRASRHVSSTMRYCPTLSLIPHGRIVVLGGDNHRIHEEIITAGGAIIEGRFTRLNVGETKAALQAATDVPVPDNIQMRFRVLWPKHQEPLMAALEARRVERTKNLQKNSKRLRKKKWTNSAR